MNGGIEMHPIKHEPHNVPSTEKRPSVSTSAKQGVETIVRMISARIVFFMTCLPFVMVRNLLSTGHEPYSTSGGVQLSLILCIMPI
jgi:hypothetical protein